MTFKLTVRNISLFAFVWINLGFALGFVFLMGPVRWVANYSRKNDFSENKESLLIKGVILALVALSLAISLLVSSNVIKAKSIITRSLVICLCVALGLLALYQFMNPQNLKTFTSKKDSSYEQFVFGSYPTVDELKVLKEEGISDVISLLHPAVTPFEPMLLNEEKENCAKVGMRLISLPMLPWVSENKESLEKIKQLADKTDRKYYVHCYLGKDRVNIVKRLIASYKNLDLNLDGDGGGRSLATVSKFERGAITDLGGNVYYTPYPTDEEYATYIIAGGIQQVVSLMDPSDKEQAARIKSEETLLKSYHIPFKNYTINTHHQSEKLMALKQLITTLPKPLILHRFFTNSPEDSLLIKVLRIKPQQLTAGIQVQ